MSVALVHTESVHTLPVRYQFSAQRRNAQNIGSFLKYSPGTGHCTDVPSLVLSNNIGQVTFSRVPFNTPLSRGREGGKN